MSSAVLEWISNKTSTITCETWSTETTPFTHNLFNFLLLLNHYPPYTYLLQVSHPPLLSYKGPNKCFREQDNKLPQTLILFQDNNLLHCTGNIFPLFTSRGTIINNPRHYLPSFQCLSISYIHLKLNHSHHSMPLF